ncbi:cation diffusion facilitator family transporter [Gorillibacterium massiliense]|uniref:cation diffusion facilitator family transporter n=1 Tax=Gorillibacterium massiliense TaxID=1280390 RepID=UPI0004B29A7F|nr:cation diffusion facilitator family transporter [Gorillibacterium massiliense]
MNKGKEKEVRLHSHSHGEGEAELMRNKDATRVLLLSLLAMLLTAGIQAVIAYFSGSVALIADTIHNFGDALTSIPLWIAFLLSRRPPSRRFTYGLKRSEDLAGLFIVAVILISAIVAGYQSVYRLLHPVEQTHLGITVLAAVIGFIGNELVALYRIRTGEKMGSAALVADGKHARIDGVTSLAVLVGVVGTWLGYPLADPIVGLLITVMILFIVKDSAQTIFTRMLDGIEPDTLDRIEQTARKVAGVETVSEVKARWAGHEINTEISVTVNSALTVGAGHHIAQAVIHELYHEIPHIGDVYVHVDPFEEAGALYHSHDYLNQSGSAKQQG